MGAQLVEEEAMTMKQAAEVAPDAVTVLIEMEAHIVESSASTSRENGDQEGISKSNIPPKKSCEKKKKEKKSHKKSSNGKEKKRKKKKKSSSKSKEKQEETLSGLTTLDKSREEEEEDDEDWLPCPQMEEDDDSEYSDFASCEASATPGWGSPQPQASPRKAQSVSHYTMKAFTTSTPATRISHNRFPVLTLPLTPLSATVATTKEQHPVCPSIVSPRRDKASRNLNMITRLSTDHDDHNSDNDSGGMTVVAPRQRRLSLWSKVSTDNQDEIQSNARQRSKRRHSIDGSMHKSTMPTLRKTRRRLSFFLDKGNKEIKSNGIDDNVDDADKATPIAKDCVTQTEESSSTKHTRCKTTIRRRHSFDCSAHQTSTPEHAPASPRRRRRLSFFGDTKDKDTTGASRKKTKRNKKSKKEAGTDNAPSSLRQPRRLSFFGDRNEITNDTKPKNKKLSFRRHSIDGSMHQSNHNTMRRRLSFFGNKTETTTESASDSLNAPMDTHQECKISLFPLFKRRLSIFGNNNKPETSEKEPLRNSNVLTIQLARNRGRRLGIFGGNKKDVDDSVVCQPKCLNENSSDSCRRYSYNTCHHTTLKPSAKDTPIVSAKKSQRRHSIDGSMHRPPTPTDSPPRRRRRLASSVAAIPTEYVIPTTKLTTKNKKFGKSKEMNRRHSIDGSMHDLKVRDDKVVRTQGFLHFASFDPERPDTNCRMDDSRPSKCRSFRRHSIDGSVHQT